jgi:hypothetical protein
MKQTIKLKQLSIYRHMKDREINEKDEKVWK